MFDQQAWDRLITRIESIHRPGFGEDEWTKVDILFPISFSVAYEISDVIRYISCPFDS